MKTRQQMRLEAARAAQQNEDNGILPNVVKKEPESEDDKPAQQPPSKKLKIAKSTGGRKVARYSGGGSKFRGAMAIPIELFLEIALYVTPPDMISLSRSCRSLRKLLMRQSAAPLWKAAIRNVPDLPPCPEDLCEPEYAALVYSKHCSGCGAKVVRPMDPYLNVRFCKSCCESELDTININIPSECSMLRYLPRSFIQTPGFHWADIICVRDEKQAFEEWRAKAWYFQGKQENANWMVAFRRARDEYAEKLKLFLDNVAKTRARELTVLKTRRREDVQRRLEYSGWEKSDWVCPFDVARQWIKLAEGLQQLTDRAWEQLYPQLVPFLETNLKLHTARSKLDRRRRRERRLRALLVEIKRRNILLEVDITTTPNTTQGIAHREDRAVILPGESSVATASSLPEMQHGGSNIGGDQNIPTPTYAAVGVTLRRAFPPMVDAFALPSVSQLLDDDTPANTLEAGFEVMRREIEEQLCSWTLDVEAKLAGLLGPITMSIVGSHAPELEPQLQLPASYANFISSTPPALKTLLRADSVFRFVNDNPCPPPLYYPELFAIAQDKTPGYFEPGYYKQPRAGDPWLPGCVQSYVEGITAAKALLEEIGRPNAAQFELKALGPSFVCGRCSDKWPRTWNEIVHHYAEASVHARMAQDCTLDVKPPIAYNNLHSDNLAPRGKGKGKPRVILYDPKEAQLLFYKRRSIVECNLCKTLGISFLAPRDIVIKHVRAVHSIKQPRAKHYTRTRKAQDHVAVPIGMESVSDSSSDSDAVDEERQNLKVRVYGPAAHWVGPKTKHHCGWMESYRRDNSKYVS